MKLSEVTRHEWILAAVLTAVACICLLAGWGTAEGQTVGEMRETVTYIASDECAGRETGSKGLFRAQQYIAQELRDAGLDPRYQEVSSPQKCQNIVAFVQGASDKYIVVGAHLDHIGTQRRRVMNGADDNASGSAAILAMAIDLHKQQNTTLVPIRHSVVFVWFTGEEHGFWGSNWYAKNLLTPVNGELKATETLPIFMLNLDMVGRLRWNFEQVAIPGDIELPVVDILERLYRRYDFGKHVVYRDGSADSDHWPFFQRGVPYVLLHTGLHPDYHESGDDTDKINYEGMLKVTHFAQDLLGAILNAGEPEYDFINGVNPRE